MPGFIQQLAAITPQRQEEVIATTLEEHFSEIADEQVFLDCAAETSADNWAVEEFEVLDYDIGESGIVVTLTYRGIGDASSELANDGEQIDGTVKAIIDDDGELWFDSVTAQLLSTGELEDGSGRGTVDRNEPTRSHDAGLA